MRKKTAEAIRDGKGWYWPSNSRKAHYYLADNRSACGRWTVLALDDDLPGIDSATGPDDCAACAKRVAEASEALAGEPAESEPDAEPDAEPEPEAESEPDMSGPIAIVHVHGYDPEVHRGETALEYAQAAASTYRSDFPGAIIGVSYNPEAAEAKSRRIIKALGG